MQSILIKVTLWIFLHRVYFHLLYRELVKLFLCWTKSKARYISENMNDSIADSYSTCSKALNVIFTVATCLLMFAALVGNIMIFVAFCKMQNLKTSANYCIVNMAVSDLLFAVLVGPYSIAEYLTGFNTLSFMKESPASLLCKSMVFMGDLSSTISVASLVLITMDRFIASVYPLRMKMVTVKLRSLLLLLTWILAVPASFPHVYHSSLVHNNGQTVCRPEENDFTVVYFYVDLIIFYCAPLITISILYYFIIKSLREARPGDNLGGHVNTRRRKQNQKVFKITISIVSACFICWTPYYMYGFVLIFNPSLVRDKCNLPLMLSYSFFPLASTVIDPAILFLFGTNYRAALRNLFGYSCKCRQMHVSSFVEQNETDTQPGTTRFRLNNTSC